MNFRPGMQGLRAIADLLVILSHGEARFFQGGFVGVAVFFVLSDCLIFGQIVDEMEARGRHWLPGRQLDHCRPNDRAWKEMASLHKGFAPKPRQQ